MYIVQFTYRPGAPFNTHCTLFNVHTDREHVVKQSVHCTLYIKTNTAKRESTDHKNTFLKHNSFYNYIFLKKDDSVVVILLHTLL